MPVHVARVLARILKLGDQKCTATSRDLGRTLPACLLENDFPEKLLFGQAIKSSTYDMTEV